MVPAYVVNLFKHHYQFIVHSIADRIDNRSIELFRGKPLRLGSYGDPLSSSTWKLGMTLSRFPKAGQDIRTNGQILILVPYGRSL